MKASILVNHTSICEQNYSIFNNINKHVEQENHEISLCYLNLTNNIMNNSFAIMNASNIYNMRETDLIANCIDTAEVLYKANVASNKILYMWDIGFILYPFNFEVVHKILSGLNLITRSSFHQKIIKSNFGLNSTIVPEFDLEAICNLHK